MFRILRNNIFTIQILANPYPKYSADSMAEHKKILSAIKKGDREKAIHCLKQHLIAGHKRAKGYLKQILQKAETSN